LLLSAALDDVEPDARDIAALLDGIPGAYEHARESLNRGREGATIALDEL
jgi:hypothetical protein